MLLPIQIKIKMEGVAKLVPKLLHKKSENFNSPASYPITASQDNGGCDSSCQIPQPIKKCLNPNCNCPECDGDCVCGRKKSIGRFLAQKDWKFWLVILVGVLVTVAVIRKRKLGRRR